MGGGQASLCRIAPKPPPPKKLLAILPVIAVTVEQLCAKSADAPSLEYVRPTHCVTCGQAARNSEGLLRVVGHGMYSRQVCGLVETGWIIIWIRRFLCLTCGHTMSLLPDWLHPWRWYAGTVIIEALFRHCILLESAAAIGARFGRPEDAGQWRSLRRWREQLLISPTLWGGLGSRLGVTTPAANRNEGKIRLERLLAEGGCIARQGIPALGEMSGAVRKTLRDLARDGRNGWSLRSFLPGCLSSDSSVRLRPASPTEKDSGPDPP